MHFILISWSYKPTRNKYWLYLILHQTCAVPLEYNQIYISKSNYLYILLYTIYPFERLNIKWFTAFYSNIDLISLWDSRLFTFIKLLSVIIFLKIYKYSHWQQLLIFFSVSNYFDSDQCCFSKFKHFGKIPYVLLPFRNKLQIRKNRSADFADRASTGVCNRTQYKALSKKT